jgi:hypothetical protein
MNTDRDGPHKETGEEEADRKPTEDEVRQDRSPPDFLCQ